MFSIIVCSINPSLLETLKQSIAKTIGCEYELIVVDNKEKSWPIAKVYNHAAEKARFGNLFFVHEDVEMLSDNWGEIIASKLSEPSCGVIGFAGSRYKSQYISGWDCRYKPYNRENYYFISDEDGKAYNRKKNNHSDFEEVICLDGCAFFVKRSVWEEHPFDEENLKAFHCYDIDFSMQSHLAGLKNYVSFQVAMLHKSAGAYDGKWIDASFEIMRDKWDSLCPLSLENPDKKISAHIKEELIWWSLKLSWHHNSPYYSYLKKEWLACPFTFKHFGRYIRYIFKYSRPKS